MPRLSSPLALAVVTLLMQLACTKDNSTSSSSTVVTDTLGNKFTVSCGASICSLLPEDNSLIARSCNSSYGTDTFALIWGRVLSVHALTVSSYGPYQINNAEPAHPVACASDADCVPAGLYANGQRITFSCINGICQDPSFDLLTSDVITLCQADIPWPDSCPYVTSNPFAERLAEIAELCGPQNKCSAVPPDCRQVGSPAIDAGGGGSVLDGGVGAVDGAGGAVDVDRSELDAGMSVDAVAIDGR
jgi:hypothetical protein